MPLRIKHDAFFKKALENPLIAKEFFALNLPPNIKALIDFNTLKSEKDSFIEDSFSSKMSDVLFSAKFAGSDGYLYLLLEHQSKPDPLMPMRLFKYMLNICDLYQNLNPEAKKLPLIYPLVFYNGKQKYTAPKNLWELFSNPSLAKNFWSNDYQLVNVHSIKDAELKENIWAGTMMFFMKHIYQRKLLKLWQEVADILPKLVRAEATIGYNYIRILLEYSLTKMEENDKLDLEKLLNTQLGDNHGDKIMTSLAQKWFNDGEAKGIEKGIEKGIQKRNVQVAENMLRQGLELRLVSQVTGISIYELQKLKASL